MKKMICILFCLLILLCSCQKTPEEPIVVGKNQETMIEKAEENENALVKEEIASRYQTEITKDKLTVSVDAEVKIAKTTMPILQVESVDFTQEQVDVMWEALVGETTMYPYAGETKSMIQEVIDEYRQKLEWQTDQDEIDRINMMIEKCEAAYQTAPESVDAYEGIPKLEVDQMDDFEGNIVSSEYTRLSAHEDPFKLKGKTFSVRNNYTKNGAPEYKDAVLSFQTSTNDYQYFESEIRDDEVIVIQAEDSVPAAAYNLTITPKEAKELAEKFTEETKEAGEFRVSVLKLVKNEIGQYAYLIECQRMMEGVPCAYIKGESTIGESEEYLKRWVYETYELVIDNDGIRAFEWHSPLNITGTEVEEAALMSFDESMAIFEKMMPVLYEAESKEDWINHSEIDITDVHLEYVRVLKQNSVDEGLLIPVWSFYGTKTLHTTYENTKTMQSYGCWLMINAIDGSIIDTAKGY